MNLLEDPDLLAKAEQCRERMKGVASHVSWSQGWNIFDLPSNGELINFFSSLSKKEMWQFERDVFDNGHDPKTYIKIQRMVESQATIQLGEEIENKETFYGNVPNCGGVCGHDGELASTSSGFRDGYHPSMDPNYARNMYGEHYQSEEEPQKPATTDRKTKEENDRKKKVKYVRR